MAENARENCNLMLISVWLWTYVYVVISKSVNLPTRITTTHNYVYYYSWEFRISSAFPRCWLAPSLFTSSLSFDFAAFKRSFPPIFSINTICVVWPNCNCYQGRNTNPNPKTQCNLITWTESWLRDEVLRISVTIINVFSLRLKYLSWESKFRNVPVIPTVYFNVSQYPLHERKACSPQYHLLWQTQYIQ